MNLIRFIASKFDEMNALKSRKGSPHSSLLLIIFCLAAVGCATHETEPDLKSDSGAKAIAAVVRPRTYQQLIERKVSAEWGAEIKNQADLLNSQTEKAGAVSYTVNVVALVAADGSVQGVRVLKSSGIRTIDELAMLTFHRISPLPKPPEHALRSGRVMVPWDFTLKK